MQQTSPMTSPKQITPQATQSTHDRGQDRVLVAPPAPRIRPVPAVSRSIAILRLLGKARAPLGVNAIAQALGLVPSTCLHILRALVEEKLVAFDRQTKHYRLGIGMLALARSALDANAFPALIQVALDQLSTAYNVTAIAVDVTDPDQMVVVALSRSTIPFRLHVDVGSVFPSLLSATGRLVAAFSQQSRSELKARFDKLRWAGSLSFETWYLEVQDAKQTEYSVDRGTYIAGVTIVAVPVRSANNAPTHTLVCASLTNQLTEADLTDLIKRMRLQADLATST
ncbi:MAG: helix-turn-helix domain-containing protein [Alcaligenaceae bacterium]